MEIAIYAVSVLYSPGPVNLLALKAGLRGPDWRVAEYCLGVGLAMFTCFALLGLAGSVLVRDRLMPWLAGVGAAYIAYPAWCLFRDDPRLETETGGRPDLHLGRGYLLQFLNPKGLMVILPVVTVMFPAAEIEGWEIPAIAALISLGAIGAPSAGRAQVPRVVQPDDGVRDKSCCRSQYSSFARIGWPAGDLRPRNRAVAAVVSVSVQARWATRYTIGMLFVARISFAIMNRGAARSPTPARAAAGLASAASSALHRSI